MTSALPLRIPRAVARSRRGAGFTLLEVMVALALLAAALMAVSDLSGNALRNHAYARDLSAATLLARGKMAELEQKYEDEGFKDYDQTDDGDFSDAGRPDVRWHLELLRPSSDLSADQLVSMMTGAGIDAQDLIAKLMGGGAAAAAAGAAGTSSNSSAPSQPTTTASGAGVGALTGLIQTQVTAFGELLKTSFREMRLTVSWRDGAAKRSFTVTTHLVVLNPKAPGGSRGDNPEVPPNLATAGALGTPAAAAAAAAGQMPGGLAPSLPQQPGTSPFSPGLRSGSTQ